MKDSSGNITNARFFLAGIFFINYFWGESGYMRNFVVFFTTIPLIPNTTDLLVLTVF